MKRETLPIRLAKHPVIWSGVGLVVRYHDDYTTKGTFWKSVGILAIVTGAGWSIMSRSADPHDRE